MLYDPNVVIHQLGVAEPEAHADDERDAFFRKHINQLRFRYLADPKVEVFARALNTGQQRVLVIEDLVPLRMIGSGLATVGKYDDHSLPQRDPFFRKLAQSDGLLAKGKFRGELSRGARGTGVSHERIEECMVSCDAADEPPRPQAKR